MSKQKCIVHGCPNHKDEGIFQGVLCMPCYIMLTSGVACSGQTFIHQIIKKVEAANMMAISINKKTGAFLQDSFE